MAINLPHYVAQGCSADDIRRLIAAGADVNGRDGFGRTALYWAHDTEQTKVLLDAKADPNLYDKAGYVPLHKAKSTEQAKALLAGGAKIPGDLRNNTHVVLAQASLAAERAALTMNQGEGHDIGPRRGRRV